jgi:DNA-binding transcriptional LysR family regulator
VTLSTAGKALYEKVHAEIASLRHAVGEMPTQEDAPSGRICITSVVDMADFFAEVVTRFVTRHPAVEVDLRLTNDNVDLVAAGIDLALRFSTVRFKDSSLNAKVLCSNDVELYASPSYLARKGIPRTPADLEGHEWVVYRRKVELRLEKGRQSFVVVTRGRITCDGLGEPPVEALGGLAGPTPANAQRRRVFGGCARHHWDASGRVSANPSSVRPQTPRVG